MEALLKDIGQRLKKYLDHKEISMNQMSKMSDNETAQIYNIVNGNKYEIDKFIKVLRQIPDINLHWLIWNEGGEGNMLRNGIHEAEVDSLLNDDLVLTREIMIKAIESLRSTIAYQSITIDVYKNALDISKASTEDLQKIVDFYTANSTLNNPDQLNSNAG